MSKTPFKMRSGNTTPFKRMGSSPVKTEGHGGAEGHTHKTKTEFKKYKVTPEGNVDITQKGLGTTTTSATVVPGKKDPYVGPKMDPKKWKAFMEMDNPPQWVINYKEKYGPKTIPGKTTTEPVSETETVEEVKRQDKLRYETPNVQRIGRNKVKLNIGGNIVRMNREEYAKWLKDEGYTPHPTQRGQYIRQSTTGKGMPYDPTWGTISKTITGKPGFDYSKIDYGKTGKVIFKTAEQRTKSKEYQDALKIAEQQAELKKKYPKKNFPFEGSE